MSDLASTPGVRVDATRHGRVVTLDGTFGRATVHEHGAHVTSWVPAGDEEALFVSRLARIDGRSAIRGGVPVIFPQFGPGPITKHGFARTARWTLAAHGTDGGENGAPWARLDLADDEATRATWPHEFQAQLTVRAERALAMSLAITNTGDTPFSFTGALHTYLRVADVTRARVQGLDGVRVRDQLAGGAERVEMEAGGVRIAGPVDRVYVDARAPLAVVDEVAGRTLRLTARGFPDVVLWNPWVEGARAFDDMDDEEWRTMLCLEAAVVATPVTLAPGARWEGVQRWSSERLAAERPTS